MADRGAGPGAGDATSALAASGPAAAAAVVAPAGAVAPAGTLRRVSAEQTVVFIMRVLAVVFAAVGVLFIAAPDAVLDAIENAGDALGGFAPAPETDQKLWLGLAFAYMVVITAIALVVSTDVARHRPLLLVLAAGKAASSLAAGAFFVWDEDVFAYLLNFLVDGTLVAIALWCWALAGRIETPG